MYVYTGEAYNINENKENEASSLFTCFCGVFSALFLTCGFCLVLVSMSAVSAGWKLYLCLSSFQCSLS